MKKFVLPVLLFIATLCGQAYSSENRPTLVASIKPLALVAADLAGEWLEVATLLGENQEPHHLSLSVSQRRMILKADLVLWVGPDLESFLVKLLDQKSVENTLSFQRILSAGQYKLKPHDPHYWLNPELVVPLYRALAKQLTALFPEKIARIEQKLAARLESLTAHTVQLQQALRPYSSARLLVDHQAYGYFTDFFQLQTAGALVDESGVAVGPRTMAGLAQLRGVSCIAVENLPPSRRVRKMAASLNIPVVAIDPLGRSVSQARGYLGLLDALADGFKACFDPVR